MYNNKSNLHFFILCFTVLFCGLGCTTSSSTCISSDRKLYSFLSPAVPRIASSSALTSGSNVQSGSSSFFTLFFFTTRLVSWTTVNFCPLYSPAFANASCMASSKKYSMMHILLFGRIMMRWILPNWEKYSFAALFSKSSRGTSLQLKVRVKH